MTNEKRKKKVISVAIHNLVIKKHKAKMRDDFAKIDRLDNAQKILQSEEDLDYERIKELGLTKWMIKTK